MFEVKTEIKIIPDGFESTNAYFHNHVLNNYLELGVKLIGRWVNEDYTVITEIWGYIDEQHYRDFFEMRKKRYIIRTVFLRSWQMINGSFQRKRWLFSQRVTTNKICI